MGWLLAIVFVTAGGSSSASPSARRKQGVDRARVLVVGTGPTAAMVVDRLMHHRSLGYQIVGAVDDATNGHTPLHRRRAVLGDLAHLNDIIRRYKVDEVIMAALREPRTGSWSRSSRICRTRRCPSRSIPTRSS